MLDYSALKAADVALSPPIVNPAAAAAALNTQTVMLPPQDFSAIEALNILLINGDWPRIVVRSETRPIDANGPISAALSAVALLQSRGMVQATNTVIWTVFQAMLTALVQSGDVGLTTQAAILALRTPAVPAWPVVLTADDVTMARSLP